VWRSLVARLLWEQNVGGSNPSTRTMEGTLSGYRSGLENHRIGDEPIGVRLLCLPPCDQGVMVHPGLPSLGDRVRFSMVAPF
jgi:hypothetical protein